MGGGEKGILETVCSEDMVETEKVRRVRMMVGPDTKMVWKVTRIGMGSGTGFEGGETRKVR